MRQPSALRGLDPAAGEARGLPSFKPQSGLARSHTPDAKRGACGYRTSPNLAAGLAASLTNASSGVEDRDQAARHNRPGWS